MLGSPRTRCPLLPRLARIKPGVDDAGTRYRRPRGPTVLTVIFPIACARIGPRSADRWRVRIGACRDRCEHRQTVHALRPLAGRSIHAGGLRGVMLCAWKRATLTLLCSGGQRCPCGCRSRHAHRWLGGSWVDGCRWCPLGGSLTVFLIVYFLRCLRLSFTIRAPRVAAAPPSSPFVIVSLCSVPNFLAVSIIGSAAAWNPSSKPPAPLAAS